MHFNYEVRNVQVIKRHSNKFRHPNAASPPFKREKETKFSHKSLLYANLRVFTFLFVVLRNLRGFARNLGKEQWRRAAGVCNNAYL